MGKKMKIALIEAKTSKNRYQDYFEFDFEQFQLCSDPSVSKVLMKDVDLKINTEDYDWVILIGSEPLKVFTKVTQVTQYAGTLVDDKFLPIINPAMLAFKPEAKRIWDKALENINSYVRGDRKKALVTGDNFIGIQDSAEAIRYIQSCIDEDDDVFGIDSETSALYPRNGYILGISLSAKADTGAYIDANYITPEVEEKLQELFTKKKAIFHNAKFDIPFFEYHFNLKIPRFEDTMLMHYVLNEVPGTHGLKQLAMQYTDYGDYERPMYDWIDQYRKDNKILKNDFCWEWIPFDIMKTYAAIDACVTYLLFKKMEGALQRGNPRLLRVYNNILLPGAKFLIDIQDNGVPFSTDRLLSGQNLMADQIHEAEQKLKSYKEVQEFEKVQGASFNPNSVIQLRRLLFDYIGLKPTGITTEKGEHSTNAEVLEKLASQHEIPALILNIRKKSKIKNTYLDKIIPQLDKDNHLRTNFNLHGTTSGRLSSSGKLNMQQIPRDDPIIKGCIKASPGHKIVAMDLTTAEMYVAAVLSDDLELQQVFKDGGNFHSTIAHRVFKLDCPVEEVADKYSTYRQAAKAISFGILYGAGPDKVASEVTKQGGRMTVGEAKTTIREYFNTFWKLEEWIEEQKSFIAANGHIYSFFGRKRRLPDAKSDNFGVKSHAIRSGLNFLFQSVASDINLIGAIEANEEIKSRRLDAKIFALVHDSVLAEVVEDQVKDYCNLLVQCTQKDRGVYIPDCPIGCDIEVGDDYSMGKFEKVYG